ncbi:MAG: exo-alpha-sialidase [Ignavibacteriaceae bacterium]|nr:exo-alpha-sialidase [Ignavibacteriaceae bacterium]
MKNTLLFIPIFLLLTTISSFAQRELSIFDKPHELNTEYWLSRVPHSFAPITFNYTPTAFSNFDNINISNDPFPQNEPSVRISRKNPNRVVAAWRDFRTGVTPALRRVGYSFSTDGGQSWSVSQLTPQIIPGAPLSSDPVVVVDTSGNFYIYTISINETTGDGEMWLFKSTDEGETFNQVYEMATGPWFEDKEWGTTDLTPTSPFANTLYCSWTRFAANTLILLIRSTDEGVTWNTPVTVSDVSGVQGSFPATSSDGDLYVAWRGGGQIRFDKSTDGGLTFGTDKVISSTPNAWFPHMAVDLSGGPFHNYIYVVWNDTRNGDDDVFLGISSDGGDSWSSAMRINNDPIGNGKDQYWPSIAISELGEIVILFYDSRNTSSNDIIEAYIARSTDGGTTFTNELLSTQPSTTNIPNGDVRFGDYINIDFVGGNIVPVWTDERAGGFDMDIYTGLIPPIVPVELISFTHRIVNGKVILDWVTATELNNLGFEIQRSTDNNIFVTVGFVEGNGNSTSNKYYSFTDENIIGKVFYRLKQVDYDGSYNYSQIIEVDGVNVTTIQLEQNYPNPFNPATTIKYQLGNDSFVNLKVFNVLGEEVAELVNKFQKAGNHQLTFNAENLPSGMYVYKLTSGNYVESKKMLLLK